MDKMSGGNFFGIKRWSQATFEFTLMAERHHRASANGKLVSPRTPFKKLMDKRIS
jgi:hypothetical protein